MTQIRPSEPANKYDGIVSKLAHYTARINKLHTAVMSVAYGRSGPSELEYFDDWVDNSIKGVQRADKSRANQRVDKDAVVPSREGEQVMAEDVPDSKTCQVLAMKAFIALQTPNLLLPNPQVKNVVHKAKEDQRFADVIAHVASKAGNVLVNNDQLAAFRDFLNASVPPQEVDGPLEKGSPKPEKLSNDL